MTDPDERHDEVRLAVPATPEFLRLARVTAAGLASRLGFTYDDIDDLRLAIDELCFGLTGAEGRLGTLHLLLRILNNGLEVEGQGHFEDGNKPTQLSELSNLILPKLVDEYEFWPGPHHPGFRMVKRCIVR
jgi:hypothetical protein